MDDILDDIPDGLSVSLDEDDSISTIDTFVDSLTDSPRLSFVNGVSLSPLSEHWTLLVMWDFEDLSGAQVRINGRDAFIFDDCDSHTIVADEYFAIMTAKAIDFRSKTGRNIELSDRELAAWVALCKWLLLY